MVLQDYHFLHASYREIASMSATARTLLHNSRSATRRHLDSHDGFDQLETLRISMYVCLHRDERPQFRVTTMAPTQVKALSALLLVPE
jgi:hypothetical protein